MEDDFVFPDRPADLCDPRCELPLRCADLVDVAGLEKEELDEFVDREEVWRESFSFTGRRRKPCHRDFARLEIVAFRTRIGRFLCVG